MSFAITAIVKITSITWIQERESIPTQYSEPSLQKMMLVFVVTLKVDEEDSPDVLPLVSV